MQEFTERLESPENQTPPTGERRAASDRRDQPTPMLSRYWLRGRRRGGRRSSDGANTYVDRYRGVEWFLVVGIVLLSLTDLIFTLDYLSKGGEEANPIMNATLQHGEGFFIAVKMGITVFGALFLLIHVRFGRVRSLLSLVFLLYCVLTVYHLYLRSELPMVDSVADTARDLVQG